MRRHPRNPILTRVDIPEVSPFVRDVTSVFNPGAVRNGDRDVLFLRVQTRGRETVLLAAESRDGVRFEVRPQLLEIEGTAELDPRPIHIYDPRLTWIESALYMVASADTDTGCHLLVARVEGDYELRLLGFTRERESRNGVLFPERIGGRYCRLERPNARTLSSGVLSGDEIWLATSEDLVDWQMERPVLAGRPHFWDELIGSGPPPVKTRDGWLHIYHGVATHLGGGLYQAGVCLLDLEDPSRVLSRGRNNILEPRELYETVGQVPNVVFPSGLIVTGTGRRKSRRVGSGAVDHTGPDDGFDDDGFVRPEARVRLYYGAADTCVGLAETTIDELLAECRLG